MTAALIGLLIVIALAALWLAARTWGAVQQFGHHAGRSDELLKEAVALKNTSESLQQELRQFKEGGLDRLIKEKLDVLSSQASRELQTREAAIRQSREELLAQQSMATRAATDFQQRIGEIREKLESLAQLQASVGELNNLLKPQQLRGELGEVIVRSLIADKLPRGQYEEEYVFRDGKKVEFALRVGERIVAVDSKLQLEAFKRAKDPALDERQRQTHRTEFKRTVRQKIDEVKSYVRPEEGTFNFAMMVIPSEAVYYDLIAGKEFVEAGGLADYARAQNVFLASPSTFWAYLCTIAQGLRGLEIERRAEEILDRLQTLASEIRDFSGEEFRLLGAHLRNAAAQYEDAKRKLQDIQEGLGSLERIEAPSLTEKGALA